MESSSKKGGACTSHAPIPNPHFTSATSTTDARPAQACDPIPLVCGRAKTWCDHDNTRIEQIANGPHEVCADCGQVVRYLSEPETRERETRALLCQILRKLAEIDATLHSPLTARRLHLRYCAQCGERVTNRNVGGFEGKSALTGQLYCDLCADEMEGGAP
jgi:hypothetical protein